VTTELANQTADAPATAPRLYGVAWWSTPELALKVAVGETVDQMSAREDGLEQISVGARDWAKAGVGVTILEMGAAQ
jgi:hypothetical protein